MTTPDTPIDSTAEEMPEHPSHLAPVAEPTLALAVRPGGSTELISAANATERVAIATEIATALDAVIKKQGMRTKVGRTKVVDEAGQERWVDKWHVNVEGWQTLALLLGIAVIPHEPEPIRDDDGRVKVCDYTVERLFYPKGTTGQQIKNGSAQPERVERAQITGTEGYKCRVEVFKDGVLIGAGNGRCDRTEEAWRDRPEYALEGMAATRAQSRAIAATARWIVTLAGYSSTPAEEMPVGTPESGSRPRPDAGLDPAGQRGAGGDRPHGVSVPAWRPNALRRVARQVDRRHRRRAGRRSWPGGGDGDQRVQEAAGRACCRCTDGPVVFGCADQYGDPGMSERWVNARIEFVIPLDGISVDDDVEAKEDAVTDTIEDMESLLGATRLRNVVVSGRWEDIDDQSEESSVLVPRQVLQRAAVYAEMTSDALWSGPGATNATQWRDAFEAAARGERSVDWPADTEAIRDPS
jgi:hypothetical protein